eukprot:GHVL01039976.1.p1 GENE.GHVL01039976.1~~GHVL01039976.1.p1  ORF type:complete len:840 (+),score=189.27 GHVL01039976.1:2282-4801(+)
MLSVVNTLGVLEIKNKLGRGGNGTVYRGVWSPSTSASVESDVAVKFIKIVDRPSPKWWALQRAVQRISNNHVMKVYGCYGQTCKRRVVVVSELIKGPSLVEWVKYYSRSVEDVQIVLIHLFTALHCLHSQGICHGDVKLDNLMNRYKCFDPLHVVLVDLDNAQFVGEVSVTRRTSFGTPEYLGPECWYKEGGVTIARDMWAAGVLFYTMIEGKFPWEIHSFDKEKILPTIKKMPSVESIFWIENPEAVNLLKGLLSVRECNRPKACECLEHKFLKEYIINTKKSQDTDISKVDPLKVDPPWVDPPRVDPPRVMRSTDIELPPAGPPPVKQPRHPTSPGGGQTSSGGGQTSSGGGHVSSGGGQVSPGGGQVSPGGGQTSPGGVQTSPGGVQTSPGGGVPGRGETFTRISRTVSANTKSDLVLLQKPPLGTPLGMLGREGSQIIHEFKNVTRLYTRVRSELPLGVYSSARVCAESSLRGHSSPRPAGPPPRSHSLSPRPFADPPSRGHTAPRPSAEPPPRGHPPPRPSAEPPPCGHISPRPSAEPPSRGYSSPIRSAEPPRRGHSSPRPSAEPPPRGHSSPRPSAQPSLRGHSSQRACVETLPRGDSPPNPSVQFLVRGHSSPRPSTAPSMSHSSPRIPPESPPLVYLSSQALQATESPLHGYSSTIAKLPNNIYPSFNIPSAETTPQVSFSKSIIYADQGLFEKNNLFCSSRVSTANINKLASNSPKGKFRNIPPPQGVTPRGLPLQGLLQRDILSPERLLQPPPKGLLLSPPQRQVFNGTIATMGAHSVGSLGGGSKSLKQSENKSDNNRYFFTNNIPFNTIICHSTRQDATSYYPRGL